LLLALTVLLGGCGPRVQDCRALLLASGEHVSITTTPNGTTGCSTSIEHVTVMTELHRDGLRWRQGQTWVDGQRTEPAEVHNAIAAVKARRDVETRIAAGQAAAETAVTKAREAGQKLLDRLRK